MPFTAGLRALLPTLGFIYAGQAACAAIAVPLQTEKYYDLCGSAGFITASLFSLYYPAYRSLRTSLPASTSVLSTLSRLPLPTPTHFHPRQLLMTTLTLLWAARLGSFLYARIQRSGKDERFDEIKRSAPKFFGAWMMQATWISATALPVYLVNALPSSAHPALGIVDGLGLAVWAAGWALEVVADRQKSEWRAAKERGEHKQGFNADGVWAYSRHPNYFGEVSLWTGHFLLSYTALSGVSPWAVAAASLSPTLEYLLIRYVSGVPLLERNMAKKLRGDASYEKYVREVPCFVPFIGSKN